MITYNITRSCMFLLSICCILFLLSMEIPICFLAGAGRLEGRAKELTAAVPAEPPNQRLPCCWEVTPFLSRDSLFGRV